MKIRGIIIKGEGKGKKLGFPTVNFDIEGKGIESGVYAGVVKILEEVINTPPPLRGTSPHLRGGSMVWRAGIFVSRDKKMLEAHLIGFKGDLYGQEVEVEIGERIRDVRDFGSDVDLRKQIEKDISFISTKFQALNFK